MTAIGAALLQATRQQDTGIFYWSITNKDGDTADDFQPPAGFGPCYLLELMLLATGIATRATITDPGLWLYARIVTDALNALDIVGSGRWIPVTGGAAGDLMCDVAIENPVLWQPGERLYLVWPELDTNASATVDYAITARVRRIPLRDQERSHR